MGYSPRGYKSQTWLRQLSTHGPRTSLASKARMEGTHSPHPTQMPGLTLRPQVFQRSESREVPEQRGGLATPPSCHPSLHPPAITWGPIPAAQTWPWLAGRPPLPSRVQKPQQPQPALTTHPASLQSALIPQRRKKLGGGAQHVKGM